MKKILIPVIGLILGAIAGAAYHFSITNTNEIFVHYRTGEFVDALGKTRQEVTGSPQLIVNDGLTYDFGEIETNRVYEHEFIVENQGVAPLKIRFKRTSSRSTIAFLSSDEMVTIEPKEALPIKVKWVARKNESSFEQSIELETNDPEAVVCQLVLKGKVKQVTATIPAENDFGQMTVQDSKSFSFNAVSYQHPNMEITGFEFLDKSRKDFYTVSYKKLSAEELGKIKDQPKSGYAVTVEMKPGQAIGYIDQDLYLKTNLPQYDRLSYSIRGTVVGDVSVRSEGLVFDEKRNLIELGVLRRGEPRKLDLSFVIRGDAIKDFKGEFLKDLSSPEGLYDVAFGAPVPQSNEVAIVPLTIVVKTPAKRINRLGPSIKDYGHVVIGTNIKNSPQVLILISFEQAGQWK